MGNKLGSTSQEENQTTSVETTQSLDIDVIIKEYQQKVLAKMSEAKQWIKMDNKNAAISSLKQKKLFIKQLVIIEEQKYTRVAAMVKLHQMSKSQIQQEAELSKNATKIYMKMGLKEELGKITLKRETLLDEALKQ
jgi:hypothetical protein